MMNQSSPPAMVAAVYGALFIALGIYLPFFPLLLAARGLNDPQIAIVIAAPMAVRAPRRKSLAYPSSARSR